MSDSRGPDQDPRGDYHRNVAWRTAQAWQQRARQTPAGGLLGSLKMLFAWLLFGTMMIVAMVLGLFFLKNQPFKRAVTVFFILNTWIIISWFDWRYGGSYSTRALVQSYPVLALPMAAFAAHFLRGRWRWPLLLLFGYLIAVNLFQLFQYRKGVIHHDHMNRRYYQAIYLNPAPGPEQFSLLDTDEFPGKRKRKAARPFHEASFETLSCGEALYETRARAWYASGAGEKWIRVTFSGDMAGGLWGTTLRAVLRRDSEVKERSFRLALPINPEGERARCGFYFRLDEGFEDGVFSLTLQSERDCRAEDVRLEVFVLE